MTILVAVAVGVPCLGVLAFLGMRRIQSLPFARSLALARSGDMRGIALQTVIILVVLLAIAGTVAAVLLSRASDVTGELEAQDVTATRIDSEVECERHRMGGAPGVWTPSATGGTCLWTDTADNTNEVTNGRCLLVGGTHADATKNTCTLVVT